MSQKLKILYIAGDSRSGSTLLSRLLGEIHGFLNIGEAARYFFAELTSHGLPCGCGQEVVKCPSWRDIVPTIPLGVQTFAARFIRQRYYPLLLLLVSFFKLQTFQSQLARLRSELRNFYYRINSKGKWRVIVDITKKPLFAYLLNQTPDIELYVVHLIRDPRGVVSSWSKSKGPLGQHSPIVVSASWMVENFMIEILRLKKVRYLRIIYEDFVRNPKRTLNEIACFIEEDNVNLDFIRGSHVTIHTQHILGSNPDKLIDKNNIFIQPRPWNSPWYVKALVSLTTFPFFCKYYLFPQRSNKNLEMDNLKREHMA